MNDFLNPSKAQDRYMEKWAEQFSERLNKGLNRPSFARIAFQQSREIERLKKIIEELENNKESETGE